MLVVNTAVVKALMTVRGLNLKSLAKLAGVREDNLRVWLSGAESADLCMARKNQIQVLRALGIDEDTPRSDTVHAWVLDESSAQRREEGMEALQTVVQAYGEATVVHFGADEDKAFSFTESSAFGLRFADFCAVLTVKPGFFRDVRFYPEAIPGMAWAEGNAVCLLPDFRFEQLSRSDVTPAEFDDFAAGQVELEKWGNLHLLAREYHIRPEEIARWMCKEVEEREMRVNLALEQSRKHVLLEDAPIVVEVPAFVEDEPLTVQAAQPVMPPVPVTPAAPAPAQVPQAVHPAPAPQAAAPQPPTAQPAAEVRSIAERRLFIQRHG